MHAFLGISLAYGLCGTTMWYNLVTVVLNFRISLSSEIMGRSQDCSNASPYAPTLQQIIWPSQSQPAEPQQLYNYELK